MKCYLIFIQLRMTLILLLKVFRILHFLPVSAFTRVLLFAKAVAINSAVLLFYIYVQEEWLSVKIWLRKLLFGRLNKQ